MPAIPEPPDRFGDGVIELREFAEWDIPETLIAFQDDPELHRRLGLAKPPTGAQLGTEVDRRLEQRLAGVAVRLTLLEPGDNDWRGRVDVTDFDWEGAGAAMRVWVSPRVRGRGYEERAVALASAWLFGRVEVDSLQVTIDGEPSRALTRGRATNDPAPRD